MLSYRSTSTLLAIYLIQMATAPCEKGTLACHTSGELANTPIHCDFTNHYVLSDDSKSCVKKQVEGCQIAAFNEVSKPCLLCEEGFVFDAEKSKCIAVPEGSKVANCKRYDPNDSSCKICDSAFYIDSNSPSCVKIETAVENCEVYSDKSTCTFCLKDFYLKDSKCVDIPTVENCQKTTGVECQTCNTGTILDRSWNSIPVANDAFFHAVQDGLLTLNAVNILATQKSVCPWKSILNCVDYASSNICQICDTDYFINSTNKCERNPLSRITNCSKYSNSVTCYQCEDQFFVSGSPTTCKAVSPVENCVKFKMNTDECETCAESHFYNQSNNTCVARTFASIVNCEILEPLSDSCQKCAEGNSKTTPFAQKCLINWQNCTTNGKIVAADGGTKHTCSECTDGTFFIDTDGTCKLRTVSHCETYTGTTNNCSKCGTGFWLDGSQCLTQEIINCKNYVENKNECVLCQPTFYQESVTSCLPVTVAGCANYTSNTDTCIECLSTKYLDSTVCKDRDQVNCETYVANQNQCSGCQPGYYIHTDFTCKVQELANCALHTKNMNECTKCSLGYHVNGTACSVNTVNNCASYTDSEDKCASCAKGYYFNATNKSCVRQSVSGCIEYTDNVNVCSKCQSGTYLSGASCVPLDKVGCIDYAPWTNNCIECAVTHYLSPAGNSCLPREKTNCLTYDGGSNNCTSCTFGYQVSNNACVALTTADCVTMGTDNKCTICVQGKFPDASGNCLSSTLIPGCKTYKTDENKCALCEDGKFASDFRRLTCTTKNITHCIAYSSGDDEESCIKCEPTLMKYVNSGGSVCSDVPNTTSCYSSPGDANDICDQCVPGVTRSGGSCSGNGAAANNFDANCLGHANIDSKTVCLSCPANFIVSPGINFKSKDIDSINCAILNTHTGICVQCKPNYELASGGICNLYTGSASAAKCNQHFLNSTKPLTDASDCSSCPSSFYMDSSTCTDRGRPNLVMNCGAYSSDSAECLSCQEGYYSQGQYYAGTCVSNPSVGVPDCILYGDDNTCKACGANFKLTPGSPGSCDAVGADGLEFTYNQFMDPTGSKQGLPSVSNCKYYAQVDADTIKCIYCNTGFVGIVKYDPANSTVHPFAFTDKNHDGTSQQEFVNTVLSCESVTTQYKNNGTDHNSGTDCELGYQVSGKPNGYACLKCPDTIGHIGTVNQDSTGASLVGTFPSIHSCTAMVSSNKAQKIFHMMGLFMPDTSGHSLRYTSHFQYDTCVTSPHVASTTSKLLYMLFPNSNGHLINSTKLDTGINRNFDHHYCILNANIDTDINCQFFILKQEITEASITVGSYDFKGKVLCGACKPGYKATRLNNAIGTCTQIDITAHDTTQNNNKWLNAAQTPVNNWKWDTSTSSHFLDLTEPISNAEAIADCYAVDTTNSICTFCKESFLAINGVCSDTTATHCAYCIGRANFEIPSSALGQMIQFSGLVVKRFFPNNTTFTNNYTPHCECHGGFLGLLTLSTAISMCRKMPAPGDATPDCRLHKYGDNTKCFECQPSHTKNTTTETCIPKIANCKETGDGTTCSTCDDAYTIIGGVCRKHNCLERDPNNALNCLICDEGKGIVAGETTYCSDDPNPDTECKHASPTSYGSCVKSRDPTKIPYNIFAIISTLNFVKTEYFLFDSTLAAYNDVPKDYLSVNLTYTPASGTTYIYFVVTITMKEKNKKYRKTVGSQPADSFCLKARTLNNCKTNNKGLNCTECDDNFELTPDGSCKGGTVSHCIKYDFSGCAQCEEDYYLDTNICHLNTATNCFTKSKTANECTLCSWDRFGPDCDSFTADNCFTRKSTENKCSSCSLNYRLDSSLCIYKDKTFCRTFLGGENECATCSSMFMYNSSVGTCVAKTATGCATFHSIIDVCDSCSLGHVASSSNCVWGTADNCGSFIAGTGDCDTCTPMAYKPTNNCILRAQPDCKTFGTVANTNTCAVCSDPTYMDGSTCTRGTEKKCQVIEDIVDQCKKCLGHLMLTGSFSCSIDNSGRCATYAYDNTCATCSGAKYVDVNGNCADNTAENCATKSELVNQCLTCTDNFWLDTADSNLCKSNTALNCETKSKLVNECVLCKTAHYKDLLDNNLCKPHLAKECNTYHLTLDECLTCLPQRLEGNSGGKKTCSTYQTNDCKTYNHASDECASCEVEKFFFQNNSIKMVCTVRSVTGCKLFVSNQDKCSECNQKTYLKDGKCETSTLIQHCLTYSIVSDQCASCEDMYFKSETKNECWLMPDGINKCSRYSNRFTCLACDSSFYLSENTCVTAPNTISDCLEYASQDECAMCRSDRYYDAVSKLCILTTNPKCKDYETKSICKSCLDPYVFNDKTKKCEDSGIVDCLSASFHELGNTCDLCKDGSIVSETKHKCEAPTVTITNCQKFETKTKCLQCSAGFIRDTNGTRCDPIQELGGANCSAAAHTAGYVCEICKLGFQMDQEGKCVKLELDYCLIPTADLKICLFCSPQSFMNKDGKCEPPSSPPTPTSSPVLSSLTVFVVALSLWIA